MPGVGTLAHSGLGGAVTPVELLPGWAQAIAPATPAYWAMEGFRAVTIDGVGLGGVLVPVGVLTGFSVVFAAVTVSRFQVEATKTSWA